MNKNKTNLSHSGNVIILGHSGFIGHHFFRYISEKYPKVTVVGLSSKELDLSKEKFPSNLGHIFTAHSRVIVLSGIKPNRLDGLSGFQKNITLAINICRLFERYPVKRVVYVSSAAVYGEDVERSSTITESSIVDPRSFYGIAKYATERMLLKTVSFSVPTSLLFVRPPVIYGPREGLYANNPAGLLTKAQKKETIKLWGDGSEKREFIYIDDAVRILEILLFGTYSGVINLASGRSYTFIDILSVISALLSRKIKVKYLKRSKKKVDLLFDNSRLKHVIGNFHFTTLEEGIVTMMHEIS